jgi:hypothetical protein
MEEDLCVWVGGGGGGWKEIGEGLGLSCMDDIFAVLLFITSGGEF